MPPTNAVYPVRWRNFWISVSKFVTLMLWGALAGIIGLRWLTTGFNAGKTFEHLSLVNTGLIFQAMPVFCFGFIMPFALWMRSAAITLHDDVLVGKNYWGFQNRIPLRDVASLSTFQRNGVNAIVVKGH